MHACELNFCLVVYALLLLPFQTDCLFPCLISSLVHIDVDPTADLRSVIGSEKMDLERIVTSTSRFSAFCAKVRFKRTGRLQPIDCWPAGPITIGSVFCRPGPN